MTDTLASLESSFATGGASAALDQLATTDLDRVDPVGPVRMGVGVASDVVVRDRGGAIVKGLSAADFLVEALASPHFYTRWSNPTLELLESRLAALAQQTGSQVAVPGSTNTSASTAMLKNR